MKKYFLDDEKLSNLSSALVRFEIDSNGKVVKHNISSYLSFKKNHGTIENMKNLEKINIKF